MSNCYLYHGDEMMMSSTLLAHRNSSYLVDMTEKLAKFSLFYLFLKLVQINFVLSEKMYVYCLYIWHCIQSETIIITVTANVVYIA
jgi:hypothetical protein